MIRDVPHNGGEYELAAGRWRVTAGEMSWDMRFDPGQTYQLTLPTQAPQVTLPSGEEITFRWVPARRRR